MFANGDRCNNDSCFYHNMDSTMRALVAQEVEHERHKLVSKVVEKS